MTNYGSAGSGKEEIEVKQKKEEHKHEELVGIISFGYAMAGKGHIGSCKICGKDFNKRTGELERAF